MILKSLAKDPLLWFTALVCAGLILLAQSQKATAPGTEGIAPLAGAPSAVERPSYQAPQDDPVLYAIMQGTFPKVDSALTLEKAFARYPWFTGPAKWLGRGMAPSRTAIVTAPLKLTGENAKLGVGSDAAAIYYTAEFGLSGDGKSFRPLSSAVEVRDASGKLIHRVSDPEFILVRRVMRGVEPGVSLRGGIAKGR